MLSKQTGIRQHHTDDVNLLAILKLLTPVSGPEIAAEVTCPQVDHRTKEVIAGEDPKCAEGPGEAGGGEDQGHGGVRGNG